jgi:diguanylate cyclase (GGDEF)-like protein
MFSQRLHAASAALWVRARGGSLHLKAHQGYPRGELPNRIDSQDGPMAAAIERGEPFAAPGASATAGIANLFVPLSAPGQAIGLLSLAAEEGQELSAQDLAQVAASARTAAVALRNALRFSALERGGLRDRQSPTYNLSYFTDSAGKELYKAGRYGRQFSVSILRFDNLDPLRAQLAPKAFSEMLRSLIGVVAKLARDSDVVSRASDIDLYLLLPETDRFGMMMLERRVEDAVRSFDERSDETRSPVVIAMGSATYPNDGQDFDELLDCCRNRLEEARQTLRRHLQLQGLDFWQSLATLLGPWPPRVEALVAERSGTAAIGASASYRGPLPEEHFARVQREIGKELTRDPSNRGLLYLGCGDQAPILPLLESLPAEVAPRICLLLRRDEGPITHPAVTTLFLAGPSPLPPGALQLEFLLYLSECSAYAYARKRLEPFAFHTSDRPLVDHLIARLQQAYDLQPY